VDADELRTKAESIRWFHTIDLGQGVTTSGVDDSPYRLQRLCMPADLRGMSVLDVGAWDGFFSFEAERRGASRVVATDYYSWHGTGWGTREGKAGFLLARAALRSSVEDRDLDIAELTPAAVGTFDIVLFLGVLYHLRDPLGALVRLSELCKRLLIVETVVDLIGYPRPAAAFYPGSELNNDPTNWWGPNHSAVVAMLRSAGFPRTETITPARSAPYRAARAVWHAAKRKNSVRVAYRQDRAVFHAYKSK
jgi:tRNA (mo5U34)-methyltransferase